MSRQVGGQDAITETISAQQFARAAAASGRTNVELAQLIGVSTSTVHNYRTNGVLSPPRRVTRVRQVMAMWLRDDQGNPYDGYSDDDLVREVQRRFLELHAALDRTAETGETVSDDAGVADPGGGDGRYTGTGGPPED